ncbi:MAG: hypothetical protein NDJ89_10130 [Oligoflexia bacterium]|nr:hypothetical protein [Oligoflexia bacterium]
MTAVGLGICSATGIAGAWAGDPGVVRAIESVSADLGKVKGLLDRSGRGDCDPSVPGLLPGCSEKIEEFCEKLHSPRHRGNIELPWGGRTEKVLLGRNPQGFSQVFAELERAKLASRNRLPKEFARKLEKRDYFGKMARYLRAKPPRSASLREVQANSRLGGELSSIWNDSVNEVLQEKMVQRHPGYLKLESFSPEISREYDGLERELHAEIYRSIWSGSARWKQVEKDFATVRSEYLRFLEESKELDPALKSDWIARIKSVTLELPGSDPDNLDHGCATTTRNAYYNWLKDRITICAGDFNSGNELFTIAHEFSHALGIHRSLYLQEKNTELATRLRSLASAVCDQATVGACPKEWAGVKERFPELAAKLIPRGGDLAPSETMVSGGFSEDSEERFSDALGSRVFARILKQVPELEGRRNLYYSSIAWTCSRPSMENTYPEEAQAEKEFSLEPHSAGKQRRLEGLTAPVREALGCAKDFEAKECAL